MDSGGCRSPGSLQLLGIHLLVRRPLHSTREPRAENAYSFGFFQRYYVDELGLSSVQASWVGSVQMFLVFLLGAFSGRALDAGHFRFAVVLGCFLQVFGAAMVSLADRFWQIFLAQGLCSGIGHGILFSPVISLLSTYFRRRRVMAVSLAACGAATGGMVFPAIAYACLPSIGFGWTVRIMALVVLVNSIFIVLVTRTRVAPRKAGPLFELAAFKELPYTLFTVGCFIELWGLYFAYFFVSACPTCNGLRLTGSRSISTHGTTLTTPSGIPWSFSS